MFLAAKSIHFLRKHADKLFSYSKEAAVSSFTIFAYAISSIILLLSAIVYIAEPPTELIAIAIDLFLASPPFSILVVLLTFVVYKIRFLAWLSHLDPHRQHPILDFFTGIGVFLVGVIGLLATFDYFDNLTSASSTDGIEIIVEILVFVGVASVIMFFAAVAINGGCRIIFNVFSGLLLLRKIRDLPDILLQQYRQHLYRLRTIIDTYKTISVYATENDMSTISAAIRIFNYGMEQVEPVGHNSFSTPTEDPTGFKA